MFVLVGPLNEHMLTADSLKAHRDLTSGIEAWLRASGIPCYVPATLSSEYYADASHPSCEGYAMLAKRLLASERFAGCVGAASAVH